jgi:hypothetical protein
MPEVPVLEARLSELHRPEIKRADIMRSLSDIHMPDFDLPRFERPSIDMPDAISKFEWPRIDLPSVDVAKAMAGAAAAAHIGRRRPRARWPLAVGALVVAVVVAGLVGWAIQSNEALRARLARGTAAIRERLAAVGPNRYDQAPFDHLQPIAFDAGETAPIEASPFIDDTTIEAAGYAADLGSDDGDGIPVAEESGSPA